MYMYSKVYDVCCLALPLKSQVHMYAYQLATDVAYMPQIFLAQSNTLYMYYTYMYIMYVFVVLA